jgi:hypothetical protein
VIIIAGWVMALYDPGFPGVMRVVWWLMMVLLVMLTLAMIAVTAIRWRELSGRSRLKAVLAIIFL